MNPGDQKTFLHAFNLITGIHPPVIRLIRAHFGDLSRAWIIGTIDDFFEAGLTLSLAQKIDAGRLTVDPVAAYEKLLKEGVFLDTVWEESYPLQLKDIPEAPLALYRRGAPLADGPAIAVVGSRSPSPYGLKVARALSRRLSDCGVTIVSGLAFGIDAAAHEAAVDAGRKTVAILASGIRKITPSSNSCLAEKILETGGTIYSEYAQDNASYKGRFLERNRIISGLARATVVVEAKECSGALSTAQYAIEQDRTLYAVPGDIDRPQAAGCLKLITDGMARPLTDIGTFIAEMDLDEREAACGRLSPLQKKIINSLRGGALDFDTLLQQTCIPPDQMNTQLSLLELQKTVTKNSRGEWIIV